MICPMIFSFFVFRTKEDYDTALFNGPWLVGDHYLHVQRWQPNFLEETAKITHIPVWIRFPMLPLEYYSVHWLHSAGNQIGKTLKVDSTTLLASRGRFTKVCVEVDLCQPLKSFYHLKNKA